MAGTMNESDTVDTNQTTIVEHDSGYHSRWWVVASIAKDQYEVHIARYRLVDGDVTERYAYNPNADGDPVWLMVAPGTEHPPTFVLTSEILHILREPWVDRSKIEEWIQSLIDQIFHAVEAMSGGDAPTAAT